MQHLWVAIDCETTGLLPRARLIELAAIVFPSQGPVIATFSELVRPPGRLPLLVTRLTGITDRDLASASSAPEVLRRFFAWLPPAGVLVAHNAPFDAAVLAKETTLAGMGPLPAQPWIDTIPIARALISLPNYRLSTIADHYAQQDHRRTHRALEDADLVRRILQHALRDGLDSEMPHLFRPMLLSSP
ncbi:MAG: 3'-5' exonuclease [Planctomycetes bacterium]|nr:3'-5' exonuclease [Planctomycetota bacterium]